MLNSESQSLKGIPMADKENKPKTLGNICMENFKGERILAYREIIIKLLSLEKIKNEFKRFRNRSHSILNEVRKIGEVETY